MIRFLLLVLSLELTCFACDELKIRALYVSLASDLDVTRNTSRDQLFRCLGEVDLDRVTTSPAVLREFLERVILNRRELLQSI